MLSKKDLWDVLLDYPTARVRLETIAMKRLEKYKKAPLDNEAEEIKKGECRQCMMYCVVQLYLYLAKYCIMVEERYYN